MEEIKTQSPDKAISQVVKPLVASAPKMAMDKMTIIIFAAIVLLGAATGYAIYASKTSGTSRIAGKDVEVVKTSTEEGVKDASTFKDTAKGTLQVNDGKFTDEGTHILIQVPGDASQNVYLTSSVVDLSKYEGKKVQVWGETFQGQKAGWLMDVGRIKAL